MRKKNPDKPSEQELAILQVLWQRGAATVKEVNAVLNEHKPTGYTTTLKLLQIMHDKQLVTRTTEGAKGRSHIYSAAVKESQINNHLLDNFIQRVFQGSTSKLVLRALGRDDASAEELQEIRKYLDQLDKK